MTSDPTTGSVPSPSFDATSSGALSNVATSDPATALLALMLESRGVQGATARQEIDHAHDLLEDARRQLREAMARAAGAQEDAGFWDGLSNLIGGDIASIAGVVAATALVVASGGTGAPAVLALVASGMSVAADVGQKLGLDPKICVVLGTAGALAGLAGGQVASTAGFWQTLAQGAAVTQAAATAGGGGAAVVSGQFLGDALDARADATRARAGEGDAMFRFEQALQLLENAARDLQRGKAAASNSVASEGDGRLALIAGIGAA
jgi:hypothetical protein